MSTVGRLAGAILAKSGDDWFLVGEFKEPCDVTTLGFEKAGEIAHRDGAPITRLRRSAPFSFEGETFEIPLEGEALARALYDRLVIYRNHSVSERIWRLLSVAQMGRREARWLIELPMPVWELVRDSVLKCS